jgi:hypothetical protein
VALQINHGRRFFNHHKVALYGEINFLASPRRDVSSSVPTGDSRLRHFLPHAWNFAVSRELACGVFDFGAGVEVRVWRFVAVRGQARDFHSGSPAYCIATVSGGQHNVVATGALVPGWR